MRRDRMDDDLLIYCFAGRGKIQTNHWQGSIQSGELLLLPRGASHKYQADKADPWSIYWCHFSGDLADEYIANMDYNDSEPVRKIGESPALKAQFQALLNETSRGYNERALLYAANMLKQLLTYIARCLTEIETVSGKHRFDLEKVQAYMLQHLDQPIDLDTLAELTNLSKYHFSKRYSEATGIAPIKHLIQMKMEYARYLLETSNMTIQDIAYRVGYTDNLYFSRLFNKSTGCSPRNYRNKHQTKS